jgi:hypothetical protein
MRQRIPRRVGWIYCAALLLSFHYALVVYINSNFLRQFFSAQFLSSLYIYGSLITLFILVLMPRLVRKLNNGRVVLTGIVLEIMALLGLSLAASPKALIFFFLIHQAVPPLLFFGLDVFLEDTLRTEDETGRVRSTYLTIGNIAFVLAPFAVSQIILLGSYRLVYIISAAMCFLLFFVIGDELQPMKTRSIEQVSFTDSVRKIIPHRSLRIVMYLDFLLRCFYALMVIYMPLHLYHTIGFSWPEIGLIFTIMLVPFVIFEAPLGRIFDKSHIEIDTLVVGFTILSISLISISFIHNKNFLVWAGLLFFSRIGASFVEVGNDFSFFKRVTGKDAGFISLFRMTGPLAYTITPLLALAFLPIVSLEKIFLAGGIILLSGVFYSLILRTRRV